MNDKSEKYEFYVSALASIWLGLSVAAAVVLVLGFKDDRNNNWLLPVVIGIIFEGVFVWAAAKLLVSIHQKMVENDRKIQALLNITASTKQAQQSATSTTSEQ